jgi:hypothetical protein
MIAPPNRAQSGAVLAAAKTKPPPAVALPLVGPVLTAAARGALANLRSGRRNGASIEQRNWLLMPCLIDSLSQLANVTVTIAVER